MARTAALFRQALFVLACCSSVWRADLRMAALANFAVHPRNQSPRWYVSYLAPSSLICVHPDLGAITELHVCHRTGCIITSADDGSLFVSSIAVVPNSSYLASTVSFYSAKLFVVHRALVEQGLYTGPESMFPFWKLLAPPLFRPLFAPVADNVIK